MLWIAVFFSSWKLCNAYVYLLFTKQLLKNIYAINNFHHLVFKLFIGEEVCSDSLTDLDHNARGTFSLIRMPIGERRDLGENALTQGIREGSETTGNKSSKGLCASTRILWKFWSFARGVAEVRGFEKAWGTEISRDSQAEDDWSFTKTQHQRIHTDIFQAFRIMASIMRWNTVSMPWL